MLWYKINIISIQNGPYCRSIPLLTCNHSLNITCYFSEHGMNSFSFLLNHWRYKGLNLKKKKNPNIKMFSELTFSLVPFGSWAVVKGLPPRHQCVCLTAKCELLRTSSLTVSVHVGIDKTYRETFNPTLFLVLFLKLERN